MTEKLQNIIKEEVLKLPKETQTAINAVNWPKIAEEIGKKYLLNENEINNFQVETLLILTGIEYPESYEANIENEVGTTKADAGKIAEEAMQKIFTPINNIFMENIKKSDKIKNGDAEQNLDFILSGGDYSAFVEIPPPLNKGRTEEGSLNSDPYPTSPLLRGRGNNPIKMNDIKNKLVI